MDTSRSAPLHPSELPDLNFGSTKHPGFAFDRLLEALHHAKSTGDYPAPAEWLRECILRTDRSFLERARFKSFEEFLWTALSRQRIKVALELEGVSFYEFGKYSNFGEMTTDNKSAMPSAMPAVVETPATSNIEAPYTPPTPANDDPAPTSSRPKHSRERKPEKESEWTSGNRYSRGDGFGDLAASTSSSAVPNSWAAQAGKVDVPGPSLPKQNENKSSLPDKASWFQPPSSGSSALEIKQPVRYQREQLLSMMQPTAKERSKTSLTQAVSQPGAVAEDTASMWSTEAVDQGETGKEPLLSKPGMTSSGHALDVVASSEPPSAGPSGLDQRAKETLQIPPAGEEEDASTVSFRDALSSVSSSESDESEAEEDFDLERDDKPRAHPQRISRRRPPRFVPDMEPIEHVAPDVFVSPATAPMTADSLVAAMTTPVASSSTSSKVKVNGKAPSSKSRSRRVELDEDDLADLADISVSPSKAAERPSTVGENSPVFSREAVDALAGDAKIGKSSLFGAILKQDGALLRSKPKDPRLLLHYDSPFTAVLCGVQGSGKSHSTSVILESCLLGDRKVPGSKSNISGLVLHFDSIASGSAILPCEAAYLACPDPARGTQACDVTVYVSPPAMTRMRSVYARIPNVKVMPFYLTPDDLDVTAMLSIMQLQGGENVPLYMAQVLGILMEISNQFSLKLFFDRIHALRRSLSPIQDAMLMQRITLLRRTVSDKHKSIKEGFKPGQLTILDLSDPFMSSSEASSVFEIVLGLHMQTPGSKIVALDEAHKYLSHTPGGRRLTASLLSIVRQQRHLGARVVISSQEPLIVPPEILDLCSFILVHRFSSPAWAAHLAKHVGGAVAPRKSNRSKDEDAQDADTSWFDFAVNLGTGEGLLFAPSGLVLRRDGTVSALGAGWLTIRTRRRYTLDGGRTILASADPFAVSTAGASAVPPSLPPPTAPVQRWIPVVLSVAKDEEEDPQDSWRR